MKSTPSSASAPHALRRRLHLLLLGAACALGALPSAQAQSGPPARILVGFPAGGSFDAIARLLADKLRDELKRQVLVENKPGAGGRLAVDVLKTSPADGSVVMLGPDALTVLYPFTFSRLSYDPVKDLVPIGTVAEFAFALATGTEPASRTLADYVAWAKKNAERANFGIPAPGSPHQFYGLVLSNSIGVTLQPIPFQGSAPAMIAVIGGQVSSNIDVFPSLVEQHRAGKVRMLAVSSPQRVAQAPEVPTFAELGYADITGMGFNGLYAPAGTPAAVVSEWNHALNKVLAQADVRARLENWGFIPAPGAPDALGARGTTGAQRWAPIIKASGFKAD